MDSPPVFDLTVSQSPYLSTDSTTMDAILTVTAVDVQRGPAVAAEVILLDCSGSMSAPPTKIAAARRAAAAAIDTVRDGTFFAVVEGATHARMCYPTEPRLAVADAATKAQAKRHVAGILAGGGTAMGTWLTLARELFAAHPDTIRHAVLLTDGQNIGETATALDRVLDECAGQFVCDARGIGDDWDPRELRRIVTVLRGTADAVSADSRLADDFRALTEAAMTKTVADLRIRVTMMPGTELHILKQAHPRELDFTANPVRRDGPVWEFSTGSWAAQDSREYHLALRVGRDDADPMAEDLQAAEIELIAMTSGHDRVAERCAPPEPVLVHWTFDPALSTRIAPKVAHYSGQAELNKAVLAGFDAYDAKRYEDAAREWGHAVRLAEESDNSEIRRRLDLLVDVVDAAKGVVRIKSNVSRVDLLGMAVGSNISSRSQSATGGSSRVSAGPPKPDITCANCGRVLPGSAKFCGVCKQSV